jgi:hypothetical protein
MAFDPEQTPDYRVDLNWEDGSHTFLFRGGILHHPALCSGPSMSIGYAIAQWARLETHIDALIFQLNRKQFYPDVAWITEKHPTNFTDKLDLLKKLFRWHPAISYLVKDVLSFAGSLRNLVGTRNIIAHSVFAEFDQCTLELIFHSFIVNRSGDINLKISKFTAADMGAYAREIDHLNADLVNISSRVFQKETIQKLQEILPRKPEEKQ